MRVRRAELADLPRLVELGKSFFDEARHSAFLLWSARLWEDHLRAAIAAGRTVLVAGELAPAGFLVGGVFHYPFALGCAFSVSYLYVDPAARGGAAGRRLLAEVERIAAKMEAREIIFCVGSGIATDRTRRLLLTLGYDDAGPLMSKVRGRV